MVDVAEATDISAGVRMAPMEDDYIPKGALFPLLQTGGHAGDAEIRSGGKNCRYYYVFRLYAQR
jgi:hypothetical protein